MIKSNKNNNTATSIAFILNGCSIGAYVVSPFTVVMSPIIQTNKFTINITSKRNSSSGKSLVKPQENKGKNIKTPIAKTYAMVLKDTPGREKNNCANTK